MLVKGQGKRLEYRINLWSEYAKRKYDGKTFKVGLSLGLQCPNRARNGCIFCLPSTFTENHSFIPIKEQLDIGIRKVSKGVGKELSYLAYFQDETTGAVPLEILEQAFETVYSEKKVKGIIVSTRPDYCSDQFLELCKKFNVHLELGLQTINDKSLIFLNRNHSFIQVEDALKRIADKNLTAGVHLIIGIPNETYDDMLLTIEYINSQRVITDVKFHNLVAFKGSKLADLNVKLLNIDEYIDVLIEILKKLSLKKTVSRLFTSNLQRNGIATNINGDKKLWLNKLLERLYKDDVYQGMNL